MRVRTLPRSSAGFWAAASVAAALGGCLSGEDRAALSRRDEIAPRFSSDSLGEDEPAAEEVSASTGLGGYLKIAARGNPELRAAFERWNAALERVPQARGLPNPWVNWTYYLRSIETRAGPFRNRYGLSQMIPWPKKLQLAGDVATAAAEAEFQRFQDAEQALFYRVKLATFDLYYLKKSIEVTEQTMALVRYYEQVARARYRTADAGQPDVIRAQLELGRLEDRLKTLKDWRAPMNAALNAALNRPSEAPLPWPEALPEGGLTLDAAALAERLRAANPELKALDAEARSADRAIDRARQDFLPDFQLGFDYIDTASSIMPNTRDSSDDAVSLTFGLRLPIWAGKVSAGLREARASKRSARARRLGRLRSLEAELQRALFDLRDAERKINLYKNTLIPKSEQAQRATAKAFETGKSDFLSLIDIERTLLEFLLNFEKARADRARSLAHIERLLGGALETP